MQIKITCETQAGRSDMHQLYPDFFEKKNPC